MGGGVAHCCLERQKREVMEPRESPCFWCWEMLANRCSSSWRPGPIRAQGTKTRDEGLKPNSCL